MQALRKSVVCDGFEEFDLRGLSQHLETVDLRAFVAIGGAIPQYGASCHELRKRQSEIPVFVVIS